jgi:hypothetical protein
VLNPAQAFERVLAVHRIAARFAMEFPSEDALKAYLKSHPDADRSKHTVKKVTEYEKVKQYLKDHGDKVVKQLREKTRAPALAPA